VVVKLKGQVRAEKRAPRSFAEDYDVSANPEGLPTTIEVIELV
jgi:hypothetical protein